MKRKYFEKIKTKPRNKNASKTSGYYSLLRRKTTRCLCPDTVQTIVEKQRNVVKDRIQRRIPASQKIQDKKIAILQRIKCDDKNGTSKKKDFRCVVPKEKSNYTRKETILRFCNTTKDLNFAGKSASYSELYDCLKAKKAFRCEDQQNPANTMCGNAI